MEHAREDRTRQPQASISRRRLLRYGAQTGTVALLALSAGCRIEIGSPAAGSARPAVPPARPPAPDEALLLSLADALAQVLRAAGRPVGAATAAQADLLTATAAQTVTQLTAVRAVLTASGVPTGSVDAALAHAGGTSATGPATSTPSSASTGPTARSTAASSTPSADGQQLLDEVARTQRRLVEDHCRPLAMTSVLSATAANRPLVVSVLVANAGSAIALGAGVDWPAATLPPAAAVTALRLVRPATYALGVATAHTSGTTRTRMTSTWNTLRREVDTLLTDAGDQAPAAPGGYRLPWPVTDQTNAVRLVARTLGELAGGCLAPLTGLPVDDASVVAVVHHAAVWVANARTWSAPVDALPGLAG